MPGISPEEAKAIVEAGAKGIGESHRPSYKKVSEAKDKEIEELTDQLKAMKEELDETKGLIDDITVPSNLTMNGKPIPAEIAHMVPYANTDQGIAERQQELQEKGLINNTGVSMKADAADKVLEQYNKQDVVSPLIEAAADYREKNPDKMVRYLSDVTMKLRGKRGFEFAKDEKGKEITVGDLKLASISRDEALRRRKEAVQQSDDAIGDSIEEFQMKTEDVNRTNPGGKTVVQPMVGHELEGSRGWKATKTWGAST